MEAKAELDPMTISFEFEPSGECDDLAELYKRLKAYNSFRYRRKGNLHVTLKGRMRHFGLWGSGGSNSPDDAYHEIATASFNSKAERNIFLDSDTNPATAMRDTIESVFNRPERDVKDEFYDKYEDTLLVSDGLSGLDGREISIKLASPMSSGCYIVHGGKYRIRKKRIGDGYVLKKVWP